MFLADCVIPTRSSSEAVAHRIVKHLAETSHGLIRDQAVLISLQNVHSAPAEWQKGPVDPFEWRRPLPHGNGRQGVHQRAEKALHLYRGVSNDRVGSSGG
jgi:hypothetical protein